MPQDLTKIIIAAKVQSAEGTPATGAGATGLEVTPSQGLRKEVARIESQLIKQNRMRNRPRHGSNSVSASYETELMVGALDPFIEALVGSTWTAAIALDESDLTSCAITDSGATITFGGGDVLGDGALVGMMARLTNMTESANNGPWFPVLTISANGRVITTLAGILTDESADSAFDIEFAKSIYTPSTYSDTFWTVEEYGQTTDQSKLGTDCIWNSLSVQQSPNQMARVSLGLGGKDMSVLATGSSPTFSSPTFAGTDPVLLLDGSIIVNGTQRLDLTSLTFGLEAPITYTPYVSSRTSAIALGQFAFTGEFAGTVTDYTDYDSFDAETDISLFLRFAERGGNSSDFISFYFGHLSFGGFGLGAGGEGTQIKTIPLFGGDDREGTTGHAQTTVLVSTSAA